MITRFRKFAVVVLFTFLVLTLTPAHAFADDITVGCGEGQQNGNMTCGAVAGSIIWTSGGEAVVMLSTGEFIILWAFVTISIWVWEEALAGDPYQAICKNCNDGYTGTNGGGGSGSNGL